MVTFCVGDYNDVLFFISWNFQINFLQFSCFLHFNHKRKMTDHEDISEIIPKKLYLTSLHCRKDPELLIERYITVICDISNQSNLPQIEGISYHIFPLEDHETQDITLELEQIYQIFINEIENNPHGRVLIHCIHGVSRSATFVIYCLMRYQSISLKRAFQHVKSIRRMILPNSGFMRQLINAEMDLFGVTTLKLGKYGQYIWLDTNSSENKEIER